MYVGVCMYALVAHARRRAELDNCSHGAPRAGHCGRDVSLYHSVCSVERDAPFLLSSLLHG